VSALGYYLEEEGIPTVAISLIRPQTEKTKPPRALWVPFELGRPFGAPSDAAFQRRVILAALQLVGSDEGPVLLEDFSEEDPRAQPDPEWRRPLLAEAPGGDLGQDLQQEIAALGDPYRSRLAQRERTTVGLSGTSLEECGAYVAAWLSDQAPQSPCEDFSPPLMLRFAIDDLKAYYLEAGAAGDAKPSSRQLGDWLWNETILGHAIHALRETHLASSDERLKLIAGNFLVPAARVRSAR
jgi:hypothetical protein